MTHAASAPISQVSRMSPVPMALALTLHVTMILGLWWISAVKPPLLPREEAIDVTIERAVVKPPVPEPKAEPATPPPPVASQPALAPDPAPTPQPPSPIALPAAPEPPMPSVASVPPSPSPAPSPPPQILAAPEAAAQQPAPEPPPETEPPQLRQALPMPQTLEPPTDRDFAKPAPPPPKPPQPQTAPPRTPPPAQPRPPANNQASIPQPSPLRPGDVIVGPTGGQSNYYSQIARRLAQYRYYPRTAQNSGEEGRVTIRLTVARDGNLVDVRVEHSSGSPSIDAAELEAARRAAPFGPLPPSILGDQATFMMSVNYDLTDPRARRAR